MQTSPGATTGVVVMAITLHLLFTNYYYPSLLFAHGFPAIAFNRRILSLAFLGCEVTFSWAFVGFRGRSWHLPLSSPARRPHTTVCQPSRETCQVEA
jgi:hypothetical protein